MSPSAIAGLIDHTLLKPEATAEAIRKLCAQAIEHRFAAVCVNPYWVPLAVAEAGDIPVASVVGFPLGAHDSAIKANETRNAVRAGAREIDMVINIGELIGGNHAQVRSDIRSVVEAAAGARVKVILETALLTDEQKRIACELAVQAGAAFVKTSTGFGPGGATVHDVALMRAVVGDTTGVKASGGIRTLADLRKMVQAGANRIGTSNGVAILMESGGGASLKEAGTE